MSQFQLSDIFIGQFTLTQGFGTNPDWYKKFGLRGHNGADWGAPSMTPILSTADGWINKIAYDPQGYGNYVKVVHNGYYSRYAHLNSTIGVVGQRVVAGQLIGYSNNTGFSTGPHLHFGIAPCDVNGKETEDGNGFSGHIDPLGPRCNWTIHNYKEPVLQTAVYNVNELAATREEANLNWDCFSGLTSYMGLQADPKDKKATLQKAKDIVDSYNREIARITGEREDWKKKYEQEAKNNIDLLEANKTVSNADGDYAQKALDAEKLAAKRLGLLKDIGHIVSVEIPVDDEKLRDVIVAKVIEEEHEKKELQDKLDENTPPPPPPSDPSTSPINSPVFEKEVSNSLMSGIARLFNLFLTKKK